MLLSASNVIMKKIQLRITHLLFILLFIFSSIHLAKAEYTSINYNTKNGLTENNVYSLFLDTSNFLWVSFDDGLMRFDGKQFRKYFSTINTYGSLQLCKTLAGEMLILDADGGVFRFINKKEDTLRKSVINSLNSYAIKGIIPTSSAYLKLLNPHINKNIHQKSFIKPFTLLPLNESEYFIRSREGLLLFKNGNLVTDLNLGAYQPSHFFRLNGHYYFFSKTNKLFLLDEKKLSVTECKLNGNILNRLDFTNASASIGELFWEDNNSDPCLLFGNSLYSLTINTTIKTEVTCELLTDAVPDNCSITAIVFSKKNHFIAFGTNTRGLFIYKEALFKTLTYPNPENKTSNAYYTQIEIDSNSLYTDWSRDFTLAGGTKSKWNIKSESEENIFKDSKGFLWLRQNARIIKYNTVTGEQKQIYNPTNEIPFSFYEEGDSLWVGSTKGLFNIKNDSIKFNVYLNSGETNTNQSQVFRGKDGKLWFCNFTGVYRYNEQLKTVDTLKSLYLKFPYNISFYQDYLMVGTNGGGFYFYKDGKTVHMPADKTGGLRQVHTIIVDPYKYAWISTNKGLFRAGINQLIAYFNDTTQHIVYEYFGEENGIHCSEFNGGANPSFLYLKNGYLSLPTMDGLVWFKPNKIGEFISESPLFIDAAYLDGKPASSLAPIIAPSNIANLQIDFTTPYWGSTENLFMEYKLEGYSKDWISLPGLQRSIHFSNLPSGDYLLQVRKRSRLLQPTFVSIEIPILIEKKYFETWWFILLCILGVLILIIAIARIYAQNIKKRNIILEENVKQRTNELTAANKELQNSVSEKDKLISIISHDILTPLRFIKMVAGKGADKSTLLEKEKIQSALSDIKKTSERLYDNAQNILNWIKHQNKRIAVQKTNVAIGVLVEEITEMFSEIAASKETNIINLVSFDDIIKTDKNIISIILHNLVSNSVKFTHKGYIQISAHQTDTDYQICIEDSGYGMNAELLNRVKKTLKKETTVSINISSGENGNGLGYIIIVELLELLQGTLAIESKIGKGTKVIIHLYQAE
jgi:signal transduction histidine kinase